MIWNYADECVGSEVVRIAPSMQRPDEKCVKNDPFLFVEWDIEPIN